VMVVAAVVVVVIVSVSVSVSISDTVSVSISVARDPRIRVDSNIAVGRDAPIELEKEGVVRKADTLFGERVGVLAHNVSEFHPLVATVIITATAIVTAIATATAPCLGVVRPDAGVVGPWIAVRGGHHHVGCHQRSRALVGSVDRVRERDKVGISVEGGVAASHHELSLAGSKRTRSRSKSRTDCLELDSFFVLGLRVSIRIGRRRCRQNRCRRCRCRCRCCC